jgi:Gram-negative porin
MATQIKKTKLAAAVATAVVGLGLSAAANAVVVVGGDNGWEVSFDGNINAFFVQQNNDEGWNNLGFGNANDTGGDGRNAEDISRVTSGFLPAFFSFNVKSPTVNGMTGSARFSFAPTIQNATNKNQLTSNGAIEGASIDTREVLVNLDGAFGTISYGRTLSIYGRQAILKDMTLFGVGVANQDGAAVSAGRIGRGYTYPNFNARFSYKTPNLGGLQGEVGLYDPAHEDTAPGDILDETDTPRFEGEVSYTTTVSGGSVQAWVDGLWQDIESTRLGASDDVTVHGWGAGSEWKFMGAALTGYYYKGRGLGRSLQFVGGTRCNDGFGSALTAGSECQEADNDGFYVQGTYTFNGKTKVGASYGESNQEGFSSGSTLASAAQLAPTGDVELNMWTVGVYHDVNSWLKVIAEYSSLENNYGNVGTTIGQDVESDTFSVGSFFFW